VVTELLLGFPTSFATPEMLAKQQALFDVLHEGLIALPINLPITGVTQSFVPSGLDLIVTEVVMACKSVLCCFFEYQSDINALSRRAVLQFAQSTPGWLLLFASQQSFATSSWHKMSTFLLYVLPACLALCSRMQLNIVCA